MDPISALIGFAIGWSTGIGYGRRHQHPWKTMKNTANEFVVWAHKAYKGGPTSPGGENVKHPGSENEAEKETA